MLNVRITTDAIDVSSLLRTFSDQDDNVGAVVTFSGQARGGSVTALELEHYPGMTEERIGAMMRSAASRWPVCAMEVVHRVGRILPRETIVWVAASSAHRAAAFSACEFVMDYLKVGAPLWKRERDTGGNWHWVQARESDHERRNRWSAGVRKESS
ncbi:MAG: molybdenum cofactor biosynthesis protein MoaE [Pseudomonadota bacterium]